MKYAFEPFGSLQGILNGSSFRILPTGKWYRGNRILDITPERLGEIATNIKNGLPRFKPPINLDHKSDAGKVGTVLDVEYVENGSDGPGLYVTKYELTDKGKKAISEDGYDAVSGEVVWTLYDSDGKYQDPKTGSYHDNVLVGIGLTPRPFFGHNEVALFTSTPSKDDNMLDDIREKLSSLLDMFREFDTEDRKKAAKSGAAMPDGSYPIENDGDLQNAIHAIGRGSAPHDEIKAHIIKRAKALGKTDMLPEDWMHKKGEKMSDTNDQNKKDETVAVVAPEEFTALKAKADALEASAKEQAEKFATLLADEKKRADEFATQLATEKKTRRMTELKTRADNLSALPVKVDEYAEKFYALENADAELAKWFDAKFEALNTLLAQSAIFSQISRERADANTETLETFTNKVLAEKFGNDKSKYGLALIEAGKLRPDLAQAHLVDPSFNNS